MHHRLPHRLLILVLMPLIFSVGSAEAASGQTDENADESRSGRQKDGWDITLGAGAASMPKYPGSDEQKLRMLPMIAVRYGRFFIGGDSGAGGGAGGGIGVNVYEDHNLRVGAMVSVGAFKARKEADDPRLHGLGDIDGTTRLGAFASYKLGWLSADASVSSDVGDNKQGTVAKLGLSANWSPSPRLRISAGPNMTWANGEYMQTFFGIDALQSQRSGRAPYRAGGGVSGVGFGASAHYGFDAHWGLGAFVSTSQLQGDAKDSPITQDKTQSSFGLFATYRF
jgi:outer membrane protein